MPITNAPPPVIGSRKPTAAVKKAAPVSKNAERADALNGLGQLAQVPLIATRQFADAGAVSLYWPNIAKEIANLADSQEAVANLVDPLIKVGPYTALVAAILPFFVQIAVNHNRMAPGAMGTVPATMLSAQVETQLAQAELEALRMQAQAEGAAAAMRQEMEEQRKAATATVNDHSVTGDE